jgi:hypothetical protein
MPIVVIAALALLSWSMYAFGGQEARDIMDGNSDKYAVVGRANQLLPGITGEALLLIGTTDKFAFM